MPLFVPGFSGTRFGSDGFFVNLSAGRGVYSYAGRYCELSNFDGLEPMISFWPEYSRERKGIGSLADQPANTLSAPVLRL